MYRRLLHESPSTLSSSEEVIIAFPETKPIDEVKTIIALPKVDGEFFEDISDVSNVVIGRDVADQLSEFVTCITAMYGSCPFHNFEHASNVTMSVVKLLSQINDLDPLTQFACALSALVHDAEHSGVPNTQLATENAQIATTYGSKSIAEQNSFDLAWGLLMNSNYAELRAAIYSNGTELKQLRQVMINSVMATDILDKELHAERTIRWQHALPTNYHDEETSNGKATAIIENVMQASDVVHTMQHWEIYRKWNEHYFTECYMAYKQGRAEKNPAEMWYEVELDFFDSIVIPLARNLKLCGAFGVKTDEYLVYATKNRRQWESRGREVVTEMVNNQSKIPENEATQKKCIMWLDTLDQSSTQ